MTSSGPEGIRGGNSYRSLEEEVPGESAALRESMTFRGGSASSRQLTRKVRINKCADLTLLPLSDLLGSSLTKPNQKPGEAFTWFIKAWEVVQRRVEGQGICYGTSDSICLAGTLSAFTVEILSYWPSKVKWWFRKSFFLFFSPPVFIALLLVEEKRESKLLVPEDSTGPNEL